MPQLRGSEPILGLNRNNIGDWIMENAKNKLGDNKVEI
jgi:hypothetical protein